MSRPGRVQSIALSPILEDSAKTPARQWGCRQRVVHQDEASGPGTRWIERVGYGVQTGADAGVGFVLEKRGAHR